MIPTRAAGLLVGYLADLVLGDPRRRHPVAGFGAAAARLERIDYRDHRLAGTLHVAMLLGAVAGTTVAATRAAERAGPFWSTALVALATWTSLGGTSLARTGARMADLLDNGDLDGARRLLPSLCGRDPAGLDEAGLARAALESIAENTSDAQVAPLLWGAGAGAGGILTYRAINTLDAMVGHRSPRYRRFGWAAARLDDIANYLGARLTGILVVVCAPLVGGSALGATRAWFRDAGRHPSPNAGVVEAAFAGALGVRLGGPTQYHYELQIRPTLGAGAVPTAADLRRAVRLSRWVQAAAAVTTAGAVAAVSVVGRTGRRASPRR